MNPARILALLVIALAALVVPVSVCSADLLVRGYVGTGNDNPLYDRFANSSDFIGAGLNFSGVGQDASGGVNADQNRWATLISPHFFVSAGHWPPSGTVTFYDDNSKTISHSYSILGGEQIYDSGTATDVYVGILGSAASSEQCYPLLDPTYVEQGQSILVYGEPNRVGTNVFTADDVLTFDLQRKNADGSLTTISTQKGYQFYYPNNGNPGDAQLEPYDSGGPSFVRIGDQLVLVGIHSAQELLRMGTFRPTPRLRSTLTRSMRRWRTLPRSTV